MYEAIRTAIINAITSNSDQIEAAYRTERSSVDGYPAAVVVPSENESDYHQTSPGSNKETYIFTIRVFYPFTEGQEEADLALEKAIDELIGIFRDRSILGAAADWVSPVPSRWGYQTRGDGTMRVAELTIRAVKYIDPSTP